MADNFVTDAGAGGNTYASDDITSVHYPILKLAHGALNSATLVSTASGLPVQQQGSWVVDAHAVTNAGTFAVQIDAGAVTSLALIDDTVYAEDVASAAADKGIGMLAVQKATPANTAGTDGDYEFLQMSAGRLWTSSTITGTVTVDGSGVTQPVSNANLTTIAGAVSGTEMQVDVLTIAAGNNNIGDVDVASVVPGTGATNLGKAEDAAHASGDVGVMALSVRQDTAAALGGLDADYQPLITDASGRLHVNVGNTVTVASHAVTNAGTFATQVDGAALTALQLIDDVVFADDAAFTLASSKTAVVGAIRDDALAALTAVEGDVVPLRVNSTGALHVTGGGGGTQYNIDDVASATAAGTVALVVRKDTGASLAGTDGDITGLQVDASGALRVTGGGGGTEYTVDAAAPAAPVGTTLVMERDDALSALTEIEGDWTNARASANGALWVSVDGSAAVTNAGLTELAAAINASSQMDVNIAASNATITVASHAVTNAGTFATQVDGAALTALQLIDNLVLAEDAAHVSADPGVQLLAVRKATPANVSGTDGDYEPLQVSAGRLWASAIIDTALPAGTNAIGKLAANSGVDIGDVDVLSIAAGTNSIGNVGLVGRTTGGLTIFQSIDLDETEEEIKATAGQIFSISAFNHTAAPLYLKFYNLTAANTTVGTSTPVATFTVPGNADSDGAGFVWNNTIGLAFGTAISAAVTTAIAVADTGAPAANACSVVIGYV